MNKNKRNFWIDLTLLAMLGLTTATGIVMHVDGGVENVPVWINTLHKAFGIMMVITVVPHLRFHKEWFKAVAFMPAKPKSGRGRTNLLINGLLFTLVISIVITGLIPIPRPHMALSILFVLMVGAHQLLHAKWITRNTQRYLFGIESKQGKLAKSTTYSPTTEMN